MGNCATKQLKTKIDTLNLHAKLLNATCDNTCEYIFSFEKAKVIKCYDGDTITIAVIFDNDIFKFNCRLLGYDSPEIKSKNPEERKKAILARDTLSEKILNKIVNVKVSPHKDKYGRLLITVLYNSSRSEHNLQNINEWMISQGLGYPYNGGTKREFSSEEKK